MFEKVSKTITVPKNVGVDGFIRAVKGILRLPRVQRINIDHKGTVEYDYYKLEGADDTPLSIDFEDLQASSVIRNVDMQELELVEDDPAPVVMCHLFRMCRIAHLVPIVLVTGADTVFWKWHENAGVRGLEDTPDHAYGLPLVFDDRIPDETIVLCGGYDKESTLVDTVKVFKAVMLA